VVFVEMGGLVDRDNRDNCLVPGPVLTEDTAILVGSIVVGDKEVARPVGRLAEDRGTSVAAEDADQTEDGVVVAEDRGIFVAAEDKADDQIEDRAAEGKEMAVEVGVEQREV
jgi:prophage tail gpP-like protein